MTSLFKTGLALLASIAVLFVFIRFGSGNLVSSIAGNASTEKAATLPDGQLIGKRAPYFDLPDIAGNHVSLSEFNDTPLLIVFWSTWNADAADAMKILDDYEGKRLATDKVVQVVAISSQEERSIVASFMRRGGYRVQTLVDAQGITSEEYRVTSLPTFYFVDRSGVVREAYTGLLSEKMVVDKIENILR